MMPCRGWRELAAVLFIATTLTVGFTYPLILKLGRLGRMDNADGQLSIWNVAWVARTLVVDPLHVFDANLFYPHRHTLAYSETNLGAGVLAIPAYWATRNPYVAHNVVLLLAFILSASGMYYLARYVAHDRRAAAVSAICCAFCPYVFARTPHIQLLMTFALPFTMLAFHRLADRPSARRGTMLGVTMAAATAFCAYYGVFLAMMVGFAVLVVASTRRRWSDRRYWSAVAVAAVVALLLILPLFAPYLLLQRATGFARSLDSARFASANWPAYFASSAYAHAWMLSFLPPWRDVVFPGFVAAILGTAGTVAGWQMGGQTRELVILYGGLAVLAFWASFGPAAGLYSVFYQTLPPFTLMHAPSRFGLVVVFALSILLAPALQALLARVSRPTRVGAIVAAVAVAELWVTIPFQETTPPSPAYRVLAALPRAPAIEMPYFDLPPFFPRHALYMLNSTSHWMPLVNGYSDYLPDDFVENAPALAPFPFPRSFKVVQRLGIRYAMFHMTVYDDKTRHEVMGRLDEFAPYLRPLYIDEETRLYEIVGSPP